MQRRQQLAKLQERVRLAAENLRRTSLARQEGLGQLERIERLLASCERSLQDLHLDESSGSSPPQPAVPPKRTTAATPTAQRPGVSMPDPEEQAAYAKVQSLLAEQQDLKAAKASVSQELANARAEVKRCQADADLQLDPAYYEPHLAIAGTEDLAAFVADHDLPPIDRASGDSDTRYERYRDCFTQTGEDGKLELRPEFLDSDMAFPAFSALYDTLFPEGFGGRSALMHCLLEHLRPAIGAPLRDGGSGMLGVVRNAMVSAFDEVMAFSRAAVAVGRAQDGGPSRRVRLDTGYRVSRAREREIRRRNEQLLQLQERPAHRMAIIEDAAEVVGRLLEAVARIHSQAQEKTAAAQARLDGLSARLRPIFQRAVDLERELEQATAQHKQLVASRRRRAAAEPVKLRPAAPAITQTQTPSEGPDPEARRLKLRGELSQRRDEVEAAKGRVSEADRAVRQARAELHALQESLETAVVAHERELDAGRREWADQREEMSGLHQQLASAEQRVESLRQRLRDSPARQKLVSDFAWDTAVERHIDLDAEALRMRASLTGRASSYMSRAELGRVSAEIHAHLSNREEFRAVMQARSQAEFERAAKAIPGGVVDRLHDHGRVIGRGFGHDLDRTGKATELTQSCYSLKFVQGRAVISHLYPHVPVRQLRAAE